MSNKTVIVLLGVVAGFIVLGGCGESVNYDKAKLQAGDHTTEYILHVSGMT